MKRIEVLCADDSAINRRFIAAMLQRAGCGVHCVSDGLEALEIITADPSRFDLLITDHDMPRMTGLELITKLEELEFPGQIIMNSATLKFEELIPHKHRRFVTLLGKPISASVLMATLSELGIAIIEGPEFDPVTA
jgi:CheY-like chemotaxis protein